MDVLYVYTVLVKYTRKRHECILGSVIDITPFSLNTQYSVPIYFLSASSKEFRISRISFNSSGVS